MLYRSILTLLLSIQVTASCAPLWNPYVEVRGRSGDYRSGAMLYGFSPLVQDDCSLLFAQGSIGQMRHQTTGSLGVGYRRKIECDSFFGLAAFADWARTGQHNNYLQGVVSGELVVRWAELRANGYVPYQKSHVLDSVFEIEVFLEELDIKQITRSFQTAEQAYPGFDVEGGFNHELGCNGRVRGYAAYFHYARQGVSDIYGPRIRVRYELDNMGCCGTRFIAEGLWQRDNVRGNKGEAMIGFRVPLCQPKCCNLCPVERRMNDLVERDIGLITRKNTRQTSETEELLARLFFFERDAMGRGTQDDPASLDFVLMTAQPCDILFGLNSDSNLPIDLTEPVQLKKGQGLYGFDNQSSVDVLVKGGFFPIVVNDLTGNGRAELRQTAMAPVVAAKNDTIIFGLKLTDGTCGIDMTNVDNVFVDKVEIDSPSVAGINLVNATNILVQHSVVEAVTAVAVNVDGGGNIAFDNCMFSNNGGGIGFKIFNTTAGPLSVMNSTLMQVNSMAAQVENTGALIDLSGLTINGTNGLETEQIIVTNTTGGSVDFGSVTFTNLDNTASDLPFVTLTNNAAPVSFASLNIQGTEGTGIFADGSTVSIADGMLDITRNPAVNFMNSTLDVTLAAVTVGNSVNNGLIFDTTTGKFTVNGPTGLVVSNVDGISIASCPGIDLNFSNVEISPFTQGIIATSSSGTFSAGALTVNSPIVSGVNLVACTMDWAFDSIDITGGTLPISWSMSTGSFAVAGATTLTPNGVGINVTGMGNADFSFDDLTITSPSEGIAWSQTSGSFASTGTTLISDPRNGIDLFQVPQIDMDFNILTITEPDRRGISLDQVTGTFDAHTVTVMNSDAFVGADESLLVTKGVGPQDNNIDVTIHTLNVDAVAANAGEVALSDCAGSFSVTDGGHIILTNAPTTSGFAAFNCTGPISIKGTDGNLFEISGMGVGNATDIAGVFVSGCESLTLDYCNIHDIGDGNAARFGVFAADMQSVVSVTNSEIDAIDGSDAATSGIAVDSITVPHDATKLAVNISENTISTSTNGAIVNFASSMADMGTLEATLANNIVSDQITGLGVNVFDYAKNNVIRIEGNMISDIAGGLIPVGCGAILRDNTESLVCIRDNMLDQGDGNNAVAILIAGDDLAGSADVTVAENDIFTTNNDWNDGVLLTTQFFAGNSTGTITTLFDSNSIEDVTNNAVAIQANASATLNATLTNNTSSVARARAISSDDNSTINVLFGDPAGGTGMGNAFTNYDLQQQDMSSFNLGAIDTGGTVSQAISNLGNTGTVSPSGTINLIPTTSVPQPTPCPAAE